MPSARSRSAVAATIRDGESIMLDTGTTTSFLARELLGHRRLTVVTNSSDIARTLATVNGNKVYMAGGELRSDQRRCLRGLGDRVRQPLQRHPRGDLHRRGRCERRRHGLRSRRGRVRPHGAAARRPPVVVTDHTKFGRQGLVQVCGFDGFDELVTDRAPPSDIIAALQAADARLTVAGQRRVWLGHARPVAVRGGNVILKQAPAGLASSTSIRPPCNCMISRTRLRPSPAP